MSPLIAPSLEIPRTTPPKRGSDIHAATTVVVKKGMNPDAGAPTPGVSSRSVPFRSAFYFGDAGYGLGKKVGAGEQCKVYEATPVSGSACDLFVTNLIKIPRHSVQVLQEEVLLIQFLQEHNIAAPYQATLSNDGDALLVSRVRGEPLGRALQQGQSIRLSTLINGLVRSGRYISDLNGNNIIVSRSGDCTPIDGRLERRHYGKEALFERYVEEFGPLLKQLGDPLYGQQVGSILDSLENYIDYPVMARIIYDKLGLQPQQWNGGRTKMAAYREKNAEPQSFWRRLFCCFGDWPETDDLGYRPVAMRGHL